MSHALCLARAIARWFPAVLAALLLAAPVKAQEPGVFDTEQEDAIREIVRDYLLANPELLVESLQVYQERQRVVEQRLRRERIFALRAELAEDPDTPVVGNPEGDVAVIEFFDYRCPYCIRVAEDLREAVRRDGNIRLVMKEFPILGPESTAVARMALAADRQDKYEEYHFALMSVGGKVNEDTAWKAAKKIGIDVDQLRADMESPEIDDMLQRNFELAQALEIRGTPSFVIGDDVVRGAMDMSRMRRLVAGVRAGAS